MRFITLLFVFLFLKAGFSQPIIFDKITRKEGLPENDILCMEQDYYGHLWFGGLNGLTMYNGYSFQSWRYNPDDSNSLPNNHIHFITSTQEHSLILGYITLGFYRFDYPKGLFLPLDKNQKRKLHKKWLSVYCAKSGIVYVGSSEGLEYYDKIHQKLIPINLGINESIFLSSIIEDAQGCLWFVCNSRKIGKYDPVTGKTETITYSNNPKGLMNIGGKVALDPQGYIWIGTEYEGLYIFNKKTKSINHLSTANNKLQSDMVLCLGRDRQSRMWVGTDNGGLYCFNQAEEAPSHFLVNAKDPNSISSNTVYAINQIEPDLMLFGTFNGGLNMINGYRHKFNTISDKGEPGKVLNHGSVLDICATSNGKIWIGTDGGGLNLYDPKNQTFTYFSKENHKMPHSSVARSVYVDSKSRIWSGSYAGGAAVFDSTFRHLKTFSLESKDRINSDHAWCITEDLKHQIWIGTLNNGIERISKDLSRIDHFCYDEVDHSGLRTTRVEQMLVDKKGTLWVLAETLHYFDSISNKFQEYKYPGVKLPGSLFDICLDNSGNIWIGGGELTFCKIPYNKKEKPVLYPSSTGWLGSAVMSIQTDDEDNVWLATDVGISCLKREKSAEHFLNFDLHDGVMPGQFNKGSKWKDENGILYFGGTDGFNRFHPSQIILNEHLPKVSISDIRIYNEPLSTIPGYKKKRAVFWNDSTLTFDHNINMISIEFAALDFVLPEKNRFSYILEGFDRHWSFSRPGSHMTTYTNLDPGKYIFKVKGANNDGKWNTEISKLYIEILPPWWKTWWFRSLMLLAIAGTILGIFYWRTRLIRQRNLELKSEVEAQTYALRNINSELAGLYSNLTESIQAAEVIQGGILPEQEVLEEYFGNIKVLFKPKDLVSGDFYWCAKIGSRRFIAAIDCTGHGVAGAFMTFIAYETLNQIVRENPLSEAGEIVTFLNQEILNSLNRYREGKINAGMDVALCIWNKDAGTMQYAGANNPLYIVRDSKVQIYKPDRQGVGGRQIKPNYSFHTQHIQLNKMDQIYLFSDGFADQIGGPEGNAKYMYPRFRETLCVLQNLPLQDRMNCLQKSFEDWMGKNEQLDDVLIIGLEIF
ncbi:MAG: SpoIIE family protein phosphatase [Opitutaceae bacterium]|nr:SpoIIE family protein phosphatase [Cytophagales bacterium]